MKGLSLLMVRAVTERLVALGFQTRLASGFSTIELTPGVLGFVGLNKAFEGYENAVAVNPVIGVSHGEIESMLVELRGGSQNGAIPSTASLPLGYVMPERRFREWVFEPETIESQADDMVGAIRDYGIPAIRGLTELPDLVRRIEEGWGFPHKLAYRLPIAYLLAGHRDRALGVLERELHALGDRRDRAAEDYRTFAHAFRVRVDTGR